MSNVRRRRRSRGDRHRANECMKQTSAPRIMKADPSILFHDRYYLSQIGSIGRMAPFDHYLETGWKQALDPHPLIDGGFYFAKNPDVAKAGVPPLVHYVLHGAAEGRDPHPLFDTAYYRKRLAERDIVIPVGHNPLCFLLDTWFDNRVDSHPLFSGAFYLENNPDVADAGEVPLLHFLLHGVWEQRSPHPIYPRTFMANDSGVAARRLNPFLTWLKMREDSEEIELEDFLRWRYDRKVERWILLDARLQGREPTGAVETALARAVRKLAGGHSVGENPEVSILVPVYNQVHHTLGCLYSLLRSKTRYSFEIIVADGCSTDATAELLPKLIVGPIRYLRSRERLDFAENCTHAAERARGKYLVLLNNDTIVLPEWLDTLMDTFDCGAAELPVGLACSKLIYPDGSLQEAGGLLYREGTAANYGWGGNPAAPAYNFVRDVDYGSGASLAIRRRLWEELGGFDERYRPAYYEDTDLAMRVRRAGYRVVYQPLSTVVHFEGVSHGRDEKVGRKRFQRRNRDRFFMKWRKELAVFRPQPRKPYRLPFHDGRPTALVIDACTPTADRDSGSVDTVNYLRALLKFGWRVVFIPQNSVFFENYTRNLQSLGVECTYGAGMRSLQEAIGAYAEDADVVFMFRHDVVREALPTLKALAPDARRVFETVDLHHLRETREAELTGDETALSEARKTKELELAAMKACDATIVLSEYELEYLRREVSGVALYHIPIARTQPSTEGLPVSERKDILFIGGFRHPPNVDGMLWFMEEVWPKFLSSGFSERLIVVGGDLPPEIEALHGPRVRVRGHVPDVEDLFASCRFSIAPLRYGAGLKGKVVSSLGHGLPCVTTPVGAEGAPFEDRRDLLIAESPDDFNTAMLSLLRDRALWQALASQGKSFFRERFSIGSFERRLADLLRDLEPTDVSGRRRALSRRRGRIAPSPTGC